MSRCPALRRWSRAPRRRASAASQRRAGLCAARAARLRARRRSTPCTRVTSCDLDRAGAGLRGRGVLGAPSRTFFVSGNAVYLWTTASGRRGERARRQFVPLPHAVRRRPRRRRSGARLAGRPILVPSGCAARRAARCVVRAEGAGDAMWGPEVTDGAVALLRVPMARSATAATRCRSTAIGRCRRPQATAAIPQPLRRRPSALRRRRAAGRTARRPWSRSPTGGVPRAAPPRTASTGSR